MASTKLLKTEIQLIEDSSKNDISTTLVHLQPCLFLAINPLNGIVPKYLGRWHAMQ